MQYDVQVSTEGRFKYRTLWECLNVTVPSWHRRAEHGSSDDVTLWHLPGCLVCRSNPIYSTRTGGLPLALGRLNIPHTAHISLIKLRTTLAPPAMTDCGTSASPLRGPEFPDHAAGVSARGAAPPARPYDALHVAECPHPFQHPPPVSGIRYTVAGSVRFTAARLSARLTNCVPSYRISSHYLMLASLPLPRWAGLAHGGCSRKSVTRGYFQGRSGPHSPLAKRFITSHHSSLCVNWNVVALPLCCVNLSAQRVASLRTGTVPPNHCWQVPHD
jgi:hypothetical protein